jgi:rRNA-processing protein EBP2
MVKRSKLLQALDEHRGRDYEAEKQKKLVKAAEKRKAAKKAAAGENGIVEKDEVCLVSFFFFTLSL